MIDFYAARQQLLDTHPCTQDTVSLNLSEAGGRVLAQSLTAQYPSPMFDNSAMDGYALCDVSGSLKQFRVAERIAAGDSAAAISLQAGEAARIFTGAPIPEGTTAVIAQEQTECQGDVLHCLADVVAGQNIRFEAEELAVNSELLTQGTLLNTAALGLAASQGYAKVPVYQRLTAIVFSSGNEILEPSNVLCPGKIYDANRYQLIAWLSGLGLVVQDGGILPDNQARTETALSYAAKQFDIIITSGGASVGDADYLKQAISTVGALTEHNVAIKPGKPFSWGHIGNTKVFILPGNPVATFVTAQMLLLPVLRQMMGCAERHFDLPRLRVAAGFSTRKPIARREFLRAVLTTPATGPTVAELLPHQGSAMLSACVAAQVLVEIPPQTVLQKGDWVTVSVLS